MKVVYGSRNLAAAVAMVAQQLWNKLAMPIKKRLFCR
jgi:hypothetical protein